MKVLNVNPNIYYSCQRCQKIVNKTEFLIISKEITPTCSYKCKFNILYKIIKSYDKNMLCILHLTLFNDKKCDYPLNSYIFWVTKKLINLGFIDDKKEEIQNYS